MKSLQIIIVLLLVAKGASYGQNDTLPYKLFKENVILYADVGYNTAPFSLKGTFNEEVNKLKYRNNVKTALGIGVGYKWFSLRVGFTLPGNVLSESKYGDSKYFDIGLRFKIKQVYFSLDLHNYQGYAIKNAHYWNDTLNSLTPNLIQPNTRATSVSLNAWWFKSKEFNIKAAMGKIGHFTGPSKTWYFKNTMNFYGVGNDFGSIIPSELSDTTDRQQANTFGAVDIGFIPGYVYATRIKNWQFAVFGGLGGVIQANFYSKGLVTRSFVGIAPRVDFRVIGGYSKPKYFVLLSTNFDVKTLTLQSDLKYNQWFYGVKLIGGFRIPTKKSRQKDSQTP